jgi:hypothetical protein
MFLPDGDGSQLAQRMSSSPATTASLQEPKALAAGRALGPQLANPQYRAACQQPQRPDKEHSQPIRHTNLLERTFGEIRPSTKVIGRPWGERSCLKLVWTMPDHASRGWRSLTYTPAATRLLQRPAARAVHPPADPMATEPVKTAAHMPPEAAPTRSPPPAGRHHA